MMHKAGTIVTDATSAFREEEDEDEDCAAGAAGDEDVETDDTDVVAVVSVAKNSLPTALVVKTTSLLRTIILNQY